MTSFNYKIVLNNIISIFFISKLEDTGAQWPNTEGKTERASFYFIIIQHQIKTHLTVHYKHAYCMFFKQMYIDLEI